MSPVAAALIAAAILIPAGVVTAQAYNTSSSLSVAPTTDPPYYYTAGNSTILVGEVRNTSDSPVTDVLLTAAFYASDDPAPAWTVTGKPLLDVIPPGGVSPYVIELEGVGDVVTQASTRVVGFTSAAQKPDLLDMQINLAAFAEGIYLSGEIANEDGRASNDTRMHVTLYDPFTPPRPIKVYSMSLGDIEPGGKAAFLFDEIRGNRAHSMSLLVESDSLGTDPLMIRLPAQEHPPHRATIHNTALSVQPGHDGLSPSEPDGMLIKSLVSVRGDPLPLEYVYYAQVRNAETHVVEFIGIYRSEAGGAGFQSPSVVWDMPKQGTYAVETFVWDLLGVALAPQGGTVTITIP